MKTFRIPVTLLMLLLMSGCCGWFQPRYPILRRPDRPRLDNIPAEEVVKMSPEAQEKVERNFERLIDYCHKLEIAIENYNEYAREQNKLLDQIGDAE